ncbi:hypothetical protein QFZ75_008175 [Streptomyces sp. V3I8]|jgi:hypothetical protein|uniref:DUF6059 family protein n=1 Tax=Streptomyces sp. V3I8 TaxID=3042279 RepID=UPI00278AF54C|nr:DUF6059 family protein [Streptomyces sp. V3I8]MDQ1041673.1 hypothetical protein [Streptomyces sp. V3I8]
MPEFGSWWRIPRRLSKGVARALVGAGSLYLAVPEVRELLSRTTGRGAPSGLSVRPLSGPGPSHPEHVRTDLPLTAVELGLLSDLAASPAALPKTEWE